MIDKFTGVTITIELGNEIGGSRHDIAVSEAVEKMFPGCDCITNFTQYICGRPIESIYRRLTVDIDDTDSDIELIDQDLEWMRDDITSMLIEKFNRWHGKR